MYITKTDDERRAILTDLYLTRGMSYRDISKELNITVGKVRRDAIQLGIPARTKGEAQSLILAKPGAKHPTKGTIRSDAIKLTISEKRAAAWKNMSEEEKKDRSDIGKDYWENMDPTKKIELMSKARKAIRATSTNGSKLEKFLHKSLIDNGYVVEYHKTHSLQNAKLHLDLLLPKERVAIEVDGPSHFDPTVWGTESYLRNQRSDGQKTGLVLAAGMVLIRVINKNNLSQKYLRDILSQLLNTLNTIKANFPEAGLRQITIGDIV
jgi:very-short-patch-repair endonuclease